MVSLENSNFTFEDDLNEKIVEIESTFQTIFIPYTVKSIGGNVLTNNENVNFLYFEENSLLENLDECCFQNSSLLFISFKNCTKLTIIPKWCFDYSSYLHEIILPDSLKVISYGSFASTAIESIVFPDSLELINSSRITRCAAFHGCQKLKNVAFSFLH